MGIPLAAAALFWVGFFLGRRSSSEERDLAIQRSASAAQAQAAAEARAGQLGDEVKKAQAQAASEAKARAAAERQAKNREAELEKAALAAERRATVLEGALKTREAESEKLTLPGGPANEQPKAPPIKSPATPVAQAQRGSFKVYTAWPFHAAEATRRQDETARALGVPVEQSLDLPGGVKMTFVLIPAGEFLMGSPATSRPEQLLKQYGGTVEEFEREFPQHRVKITKPFWLGKYEVTQEQWQAVMRENPSGFKGKPQNPVEMVSWDDCQGFLRNLSGRRGKTFRLPTEAEWEYACRAGSASEFCFGDGPTSLGENAWFKDNSGGSTQRVGQSKPNAWGLHDMLGNDCEWCEDVYAPYQKGAQTDPKGPASGERRVLRGGSWGDVTRYFRSAYRCSRAPGRRHPYLGLRVVLVQ
jgi:formylglycine-generating enzyme required for sulfatase activity